MTLAYVVELIWGLGVTAGAIIFSALMAALFATITLMWNRKTVRDRETIDLVNRTVWDGDYIIASDTFSRLRDQENGLTNCCNDTDSSDYKTVLQFLNHYELIAIGIGSGILAKKVYQRFHRTRFVRDYQQAKPFIEACRIRAKNDRIYSEFEFLAKKWEKKHSISREDP